MSVLSGTSTGGSSTAGGSFLGSVTLNEISLNVALTPRATAKPTYTFSLSSCVSFELSGSYMMYSSTVSSDAISRL